MSQIYENRIERFSSSPWAEGARTTREYLLTATRRWARRAWESCCHGFAAHTGFRQNTVRNSPAGAIFGLPHNAQAFDIESVSRVPARLRNDFLPEFPFVGRKIKDLPEAIAPYSCSYEIDNERPRGPPRARSHRGAAGVLRRGRAIEIAGAFFKGTNHAADRLAEQHFDQLLHESGFEFEIDIEIDATAGRHRLEHPVVVEAAAGPLGIGHVDASRPIDGDARGETFAKHAKADNQIGDDEIRSTLLNSGSETPWEKLGIALDIGDEC